jgi:WD40 repeat protein
MRKPTSFFVSTLSLLVFLSLTFAACGRSTIPASAALAPSPVRDPVNQVYALAWAPDGNYIASASKDQTVHVWVDMGPRPGPSPGRLTASTACHACPPYTTHSAHWP